MKFKNYINISESMRDLYHAIGEKSANKLVDTPKDPKMEELHNKVFGYGIRNRRIEIPLTSDIPDEVRNHIESSGAKLHENGSLLLQEMNDSIFLNVPSLDRVFDTTKVFKEESDIMNFNVENPFADL